MVKIHFHRQAPGTCVRETLPLVRYLQGDPQPSFHRQSKIYEGIETVSQDAILCKLMFDCKRTSSPLTCKLNQLHRPSMLRLSYLPRG